jgi:hypothetical protein
VESPLRPRTQGCTEFLSGATPSRSFAFLLRIERPNCSLLGIVLVICMGVFLTVAGETQFEKRGFAFVMAASVMSGAHPRA